MSIFQQLAAPFEVVHWRAQSVKADGTAAMALAYIDARDVMTRLDEACGPENWRDRYTETPKGRLICTLELRIGDEWVGKSDGAGDTDVEGDKGAISDALKRAAVKWGVGRYLYDMDAVWADCTSYDKNGKKHWKAWTPAGLKKLQQAAKSVGSSTPVPIADPVPLADDKWAQLVTLVEQTGTNSRAICEHYKVENLSQLSGEQYTDVVERLSTRLQQKEAA